MGKNHTTKTAKTIYDVMRWIETTSHHKGDTLTEGFFILSGYTHTLRIPTAIAKKCADYLIPGGPFDTRMYRWNFAITDAAREERLHWLEEFMLPVDDSLDRKNFLRHFRDRLQSMRQHNYQPPDEERAKVLTRMALDPARQVPTRTKKSKPADIAKPVAKAKGSVPQVGGE